MRRKLLTALLSFAVMAVCAQQASLSGRVVEAETGNPIANATVILGNQNVSTLTNQNGEFSLIYLEDMKEEVVVEAKGYLTQIKLVQLLPDANTLEDVALKPDIQQELQDDVILQLTEDEIEDDEGRSQSMASNSSASTDVFNANTSYAWSGARYRGRGYEQRYEQTYINGISFNSAERGQFNHAMIGGLNDASRHKDLINGIEANGFTYGGIGQSTNIMMNASRYAQGWKVGLAGANRNYKGRINATYASGVLNNGWAFVGQLAWRYSPYIDQKGIIGEGIKYNSAAYFFSAEKIFNNALSLSLVTFGAPTERAQNAAVTQEVYDLTGSINYNPYWGYQNGEVRNSRIVKSYDPTAIASLNWKITDKQVFKAGLGYHYSLYSNSALTFYNAPDPRPDYYRNLPSFYWDGQIDQYGNFVTELNGQNLGTEQEYNGIYYGPSIDGASFRSLVDAWQSRDNLTTQINWDQLYAANYQNNALNPEGSAKYMLERRHNDIQEAMLNINYQNTEFKHLKITAGLEGKFSQGIHYKTVDDLLGGKQWIDIDPFSERDIKELASNIGLTQEEIENVKQNDVANPNAVIGERDKFGYDYRINMTKVAAWAQNEWNFTSVDLYYALKLTYQGLNRSTNMLNGRAWYLAQLNPDDAYLYLGRRYQTVMDNDYTGGKLTGYQHHFFDPSFKLGLTYKINGRNRLKVNALAETSAPLARDAYISPRVHDRAIGTIYTHDRAKNLKDFYAASEKVVSYDLTYEFNYPIVRGRITAFQTHFWNGSELNGYYDDEARTFVNQAITGINRIHRGIEAAAAFKLGLYFTLTPMLAISDYHHTSNAYAITSAENGMALAQNSESPVFEVGDSVMIKGLKVAAGPQLNTSLKLSFFHPKMWFADITLSYFDWSYLDYAPARRMQGLYTGRRADGTNVNGWYGDTYDGTYNALEKDEAGEVVYDKNGLPKLKYPFNILSDQESLLTGKWYNHLMLDFSVGKLIYLPHGKSLSINLSVSNATNNTKFKTGGYQQSRLPRSTKQGQTDDKNSTISSNVWKYPAKYYYAWGTNFFLSLTYKF